MKLSSPAFNHNGEIPEKYTCDGENINPPFVIEDVPGNARSLALIMDDPDALDGPFVHWLIFNFSPFTTKIEEGNLPDEASMGQNSADKTGYVGPCPPTGVHHYRFRLYALSKSLELQYPNVDDLMNAIDNNILAQAELVGIYHR